MRYREYQPRASLAPYVECYWLIDGGAEPMARQRILPDGCVELIFHLADPVRRHWADGSVTALPRSFVSGQLRRFIEIEPMGSLGVFGIRFRPLGLRPFVGAAAELSDQTIDLEALAGRTGREVVYRILEASSNRQRMKLVEAFLLRAYREEYEADATVKFAVARILESCGQVSIDSLMDSVDLSGRQLERKFQQTIGLSPKRFSRIIRFHSIFRHLRAPARTNLTALGLTCGYYDQSHFIRDFKEFAGQSPTAYFAASHPMSEFFTSADRMSNFYNPI